MPTDQPATTSVPLVSRSQRPFWLPDTQGFLAIAIILLMGTVVMVLLNQPIKFDDKTAGVLMTVLGVLTACLKDVYSYFFGSSKGEERKGDVISTIATTPTPPPVVIPPVVPVAPTPSSMGEALLANGQRAYFRQLATDEEKKKFLSLSDQERTDFMAANPMPPAPPTEP